jgi:hypothetical protein
VGWIVYIKDGAIKKPTDIKDDIAIYDRYLLYQRQLAREMKEISP